VFRRLVSALAALAIAGPAAAGGFANWAVVVVAGDDQAAHADVRTKAFDNARRDVSNLLVKRGVSRSNLAEFSVRPTAGPGNRPSMSTPEAIFGKLADLARAAPGGCLVYLTSHGSPDGVLIGGAIVPPKRLAAAVTRACGARPTAIVLSACFSGGSLPALRGPDRFILTAARRDRSSFGCSESDKYPYFDACILETLPTVDDFIALGRAARGCVAAKETAGHLSPASEPQMAVGAAISPTIPFYSFSQH
jgi:hypothetical protein